MGRLVSNFGEGGALEILAEVFFFFLCLSSVWNREEYSTPFFACRGQYSHQKKSNLVKNWAGPPKHSIPYAGGELLLHMSKHCWLGVACITHHVQ